MGEVARLRLVEALGGAALDEEWQETTDNYGRDYMTRGAARIRPLLAGDLVLLHENIMTDPAVGLRISAVRLSIIYGMVEACLGSRARANRWYRTARKIADTTDDPSLRVWVRGREAFTRGYEGSSPTDVVRLADEAIALAQKPSLGLLEAQIAKAQALSRVDAASQATEAMRSAWRTYSHVESSELGTVYSMPPWRMTMAHSHLLARIGKPSEAERVRTEAVGLKPSSLPRFGAHLEMHRAILAARVGDSDACNLALSTLRSVPAEQLSFPIQLMAREVLSAATGPRAPASAELRNLIRNTL